MKKRIPTFVAGMVTMALIGGLGIGALPPLINSPLPLTL